MGQPVFGGERWLGPVRLDPVSPVAATFEDEFSSRTDSYAGKAVVRYQW
jgi:hypothetical protein